MLFKNFPVISLSHAQHNNGQFYFDRRTTICSQRLAVGTCDSEHTRYYFNQKADECQEFIYTGFLYNPWAISDKEITKINLKKIYM